MQAKVNRSNGEIWRASVYLVASELRSWLLAAVQKRTRLMRRNGALKQRDEQKKKTKKKRKKKKKMAMAMAMMDDDEG
jgi:hypothetical protein